MSYILSDYNDSLQRASRLTACRDALVNTSSCASTTTQIEPEDILIYLRWLICHFYSQKTFQQSMKIIEWLPCQLSTEYLASSSTTQSANSNSTSSSNIIGTNNESPLLSNNNKNLDDIYGSNFINNSISANVNIADANSMASLSSILNNKFKLIDNIYLPTTNGLVNRDDVLNSISFRMYFVLNFFKFNLRLKYINLIVFNQNEIPVHNNSLQFLLPRLRYLVTYYKIDYVIFI